MKKIKFAIAVCLVCNSNFLSAQLLQETSFKKIEFASFDVNSPRTKEKDKVEIFCYSKVDDQGNIIIRNRDENNDSLSFLKYQLDTAQLKIINSVFNGKRKLREFMATENLKAGEHYGGSYEILSVVYKNGMKDTLCFIPLYMPNNFGTAFDILENVFFAKLKSETANKFSISKNFEKLIMSDFKISTYLPPIEFPPPPLLER